MSLLLNKRLPEGTLSIYSDKPNFDVIEVNQIHSNNIIEYNGKSLNLENADGIIIDPKNYSQKKLAIKTADCLPILLIGEKIAFLHAGWRGIQNKILMNSKLNDLKVENIFIAPFIQSFEVQQDFKVEFKNSNNFYSKDSKLFFNLKAEVLEQIKKCFPEAKIDISPICTLENQTYNSYRRNQTIKRNWNIFQIN